MVAAAHKPSCAPRTGQHNLILRTSHESGAALQACPPTGGSRRIDPLTAFRSQTTLWLMPAGPLDHCSRRRASGTRAVASLSLIPSAGADGTDLTCCNGPDMKEKCPGPDGPRIARSGFRGRLKGFRYILTDPVSRILAAQTLDEDVSNCPVTKPCHLPLGIATGVSLRPGDHLVSGQAAIKMVGDRLNPHRFPERAGLFAVHLPEAFDLRHSTCIKHRQKAPVTGCLKLSPRRHDQYCEERAIRIPQPFSLTIPTGQAATGMLDDLESAYDPLLIIFPDSCCGLRITGLELGIETGHPLSLETFLQFTPDSGWNGGQAVEAVCERVEIKAAAPDKNGDSSVLAACPYFLQRHAAPSAGGAAVTDIKDTIEPVRSPIQCLSPGPRRDDRQLSINLHGICIDDRSAKAFGQRNGQ